MKRWVVLLGLLLACGDDDGALDAGADTSVESDAGEDASVDAAPAEDAARPPPFEGPTGTTEGCGTPAEPGTTVRSITVDGTERSYRLAIPNDYDPDAPHALIVGWHGLGSSGSSFQRAMRFETVSSGEAIAFYPDGLPSLGGGDGWELTEDGRDVALFDAVYAELSEELCIDRARVFSSGFSLGGYMTNLLGCARGDVVRAIAPIAGAASGRDCRGQAAAWMVHGTADLVVAPTLGESARRRWLSRNGCSLDTMTVPPDGCGQYIGCDEGYPVVWCEHGGAHTVPGWVSAAAWDFFDSF